MSKLAQTERFDLIGCVRIVCLFSMLVWLCVSMLMPCDSGQVASAGALPYAPGAVPQNLAWFLLAFIVAVLRLVDMRLLERPGEPSLAVFSGRLRWLKVTFGILAAAVFVATVSAATSGNARENINVAAQWFTLFAVGWSAFHLVTDEQKATLVMSLLVGMAVAVAIHGLYQSAYEKPRDIAAYDADPEAFIRRIEFEQQISYPPGSSSRMVLEARLKDNEATGSFNLANSLAGLLASMCLIVLVAASKMLNRQTANSTVVKTLDAQVQNQVDHASKWYAGSIIASSIVFGAGLYLANSRTAVIALASGLMVWFWQATRYSVSARRFVRYVSFGITGLLSLFTISVWVLRPTEFQTAVKSVWFRLEYWRSTVAMIFEHGLFGVGPANFRDYYLRYKLPLASESPIDPHNFLLETTSTIGVIGGLALAVGLVRCIWLLVQFQGYHDQKIVDTSVSSDKPQSSKVNAIWCGSVLVSTAFAVWFIEGLIGWPPLFAPYLIGLPIAGLVAFGLNGRIWSRDEIRLASLLAVIVLFVHLNFSGGWLAPGLMCFAAAVLSIGLRMTAMSNSQPGNESRPVGGITGRCLACGSWLVGLLLFYVFVWQPVTDSQNLELSVPPYKRQGEQFNSAMIQADPFSANLIEKAVGSKFLQLQATGESSARFARGEKQFESLRDHWLKSDSVDWQVWNRAAQFELARPGGDIELAADYLEHAQQLNSTRIPLMLEAALVLEIANRSNSAEQLVKRAIQLDREIQHEDRKIWCQIVEFQRPISKIPGDSPAVDWIRSASDSKLSRGMLRAKPLAEKMSSHYDIR